MRIAAKNILPRHDELLQLILGQLSQEKQVILATEITEQQDTLWDIIGMAEGENTDVAQRHDKYLYGVTK
jgi:hypothetical protein